MAQSAILRRLYGYLSQGKQPEDVYRPGPPPDIVSGYRAVSVGNIPAKGSLPPPPPQQPAPAPLPPAPPPPPMPPPPEKAQAVKSPTATTPKACESWPWGCTG